MTTNQIPTVTAEAPAPSLAPSIVLAHLDVERHARGALEAARRAGELLLRAKAGIEHGQWLPWLAANVPGLSARTAQGYMRIAARWPELEKRNAVAHVPLREALALLAEPPRERLPDIESARLPENYVAAIQALEEYLRADEPPTWTPAERLDFYQRQAADDSLQRMADSIQARAIRRCGEMLRAFTAGEALDGDTRPQP